MIVRSVREAVAAVDLLPVEVLAWPLASRTRSFVVTEPDELAEAVTHVVRVAGAARLVPIGRALRPDSPVVSGCAGSDPATLLAA